MNEPERSIAQAVGHLIRATKALADSIDAHLDVFPDECKPHSHKAQAEIKSAGEQLLKACKHDAAVQSPPGRLQALPTAESLRRRAEEESGAALP